MYRVPKEKALILVKIPPQPPLWKTTFVSSAAETHQGRENISDIFNAPRAFLPLLGDHDTIDLVRRDAIRWVRVEEPDRFEWYHYEVRQGAPQSTVRCVFGDGEVLEGMVSAIAPTGEQRVQDIVNRKEDFMHLETGAGLFLVNLKQVSTIAVRKRIMAALDKVLDSMGPAGASLLTLVSGEIPILHGSSGTRPVHSSPLSEAQVLLYLRDLAGPEQKAALEKRLPVTFTYRDFEVKVAFPEGGTLAEVRPAAAGAGPEQTAAAPPPAKGGTLQALFYNMIAAGASDLHLTIGARPMQRLHGDMVPMEEEVLTREKMDDYLWSICPEKNRAEFEEVHDTDFAYAVEGLARFRCNYFMDRGGLGAVFRQIPAQIPTIEQLGLPSTVVDLCWLSKGFVVVTGPTGSGKSTTLAALANHINMNRRDHIVTIEDPIEFVHENKNCLVNQREVGDHTSSFKRALRAALRQDPDIVLVGEMRDLETISIAIETAETGHLVFGTLHTTTAAGTVDRIIDQFPAEQQSQIRVMLSESLKGVISQTLCRRMGGGRVAAYEILIVNSATAHLIREGKTYQIPSVMQTQKVLGNRALNDSLIELVRKKAVDPKEAYIRSVDKNGLVSLYEKHNIPFETVSE